MATPWNIPEKQRCTIFEWQLAGQLVASRIRTCKQPQNIIITNTNSDEHLYAVNLSFIFRHNASSQTEQNFVDRDWTRMTIMFARHGRGWQPLNFMWLLRNLNQASPRCAKSIGSTIWSRGESLDILICSKNIQWMLINEILLSRAGDKWPTGETKRHFAIL